MEFCFYRTQNSVRDELLDQADNIQSQQRVLKFSHSNPGAASRIDVTLVT